MGTYADQPVLNYISYLVFIKKYITMLQPINIYVVYVYYRTRIFCRLVQILYIELHCDFKLLITPRSKSEN